MTRGRHSGKPNGHAGPQHRTNGHAPASTERDALPALRDQAVPDDASGASVATHSAHQAEPGADRIAYAGTAASRPNGAARAHENEKPDTTSGSSNKTSVQKPIPPGQGPLPAHAGDFVEEIHRRIDLIEVWHRLLASKDEKIKQRAVERLTAIRYKGDAAMEEEPQQIIFDIDSAVARRSSQGDEK
jgi:hypothetical protein